VYTLEEADEEPEDEDSWVGGGEDEEGGGGAVSYHADEEDPLRAEFVRQVAEGHLDEDVAHEVRGLDHAGLGVAQLHLSAQEREERRERRPG